MEDKEDTIPNEVVEYLNEHLPSDIYLFKDNSEYLSKLVSEKRNELRLLSSELAGAMGSEVISSLEEKQHILSEVSTQLDEIEGDFKDLTLSCNETLVELSSILEKVSPVYETKKNITKNLVILKSLYNLEMLIEEYNNSNKLQALSYKDLYRLTSEMTKFVKDLEEYLEIPYVKKLKQRMDNLNSTILIRIEQDLYLYQTETYESFQNMSEEDINAVQNGLYYACRIIQSIKGKEDLRKFLTLLYQTNLIDFQNVFLNNKLDWLEFQLKGNSSDKLPSQIFVDKLVVFIKTETIKLTTTWKNIVPSAWNLSGCFIAEIIEFIDLVSIVKNYEERYKEERVIDWVSKLLSLEEELQSRYIDRVKNSLFEFNLRSKLTGKLTKDIKKYIDSEKSALEIDTDDEYEKYELSEEGKFKDLEKLLLNIYASMKRVEKLDISTEEQKSLGKLYMDCLGDYSKEHLLIIDSINPNYNALNYTEKREGNKGTKIKNPKSQFANLLGIFGSNKKKTNDNKSLGISIKGEENKSKLKQMNEKEESEITDTLKRLVGIVNTCLYLEKIVKKMIVEQKIDFTKLADDALFELRLYAQVFISDNLMKALHDENFKLFVGNRLNIYMDCICKLEEYNKFDLLKDVVSDFNEQLINSILNINVTVDFLNLQSDIYSMKDIFDEAKNSVFNEYVSENFKIVENIILLINCEDSKLIQMYIELFPEQNDSVIKAVIEQKFRGRENEAEEIINKIEELNITNLNNLRFKNSEKLEGMRKSNIRRRMSFEVGKCIWKEKEGRKIFKQNLFDNLN